MIPRIDSGPKKLILGGSDKPQEGEIAVIESETRVEGPKRYAVVLHNDDFTTMDFVVEVLQRHFGKTLEEAKQVMMKVHHDGRGVAGVYSHDIAETKVVQVTQEARARGYPLRCTMERE